MKTLLMISILAITTTSNASGLIYKWPSINGLMVNNACAAETEFRSLKDVSVCVETAIASRTACRYGGEAEYCRSLGLNEQPRIDESVNEKTKCVKSESKPITVTRVQTVMKCVQWSKPARGSDTECLKFDSVKTIMGKVFKVETDRDMGAEGGEQLAGYINYEIPNCK